MNISDEVSFKLDGESFTGFIDKAYQNSYMVTFKADNPEIVDKYHDRVVINNKKLTLIKAAPQPEVDPEADDSSEDEEK